MLSASGNIRIHIYTYILAAKEMFGKSGVLTHIQDVKASLSALMAAML